MKLLRVTAVAVLVLSSLCAAQTRPTTQPKPREWAQWRGPRRDGICDEKGLLQSWPQGGPRVLWTASDLGTGWSCPIIANGTIYITGDVGDELRIFALDLDGRPKWQSKNGRSWQGPYPGARACCIYDEGRLYHSNAHGRVACLDAETGREIWAVDTLERFEGREITWGQAENLLIDGQRVIVTPGGRKAAMAALDKKTGQTLWTSPPILSVSDNAADGASYASPILLERDGRRQIIGCTSQHIIGVDAESGRLLWKSPIPTRYRVLAMTPVICPDGIFMTGPDSGGGKLYRLKADGDRIMPEAAWTTSIDTCHGGVVLIDGFLYGSWYRSFNGWGCVDLRTGEVRYRTRELAMGSVLHADGRFYILSQTGTMALVQADSKEFRIISRFSLTDERVGDAWAHPVIVAGRLYLRYHQKLYCYDIRAK